MKRPLLTILIVLGVVIVISIVFFVFTTTMSSPTHMKLYMPKDEKDTNNYQNLTSKLTAILQGNNMIYGYYGNNIQNGKAFDFKEIHNVIMEGIQKYSKDSFFVLIKPTANASYKNTIAILDEMTISDIKRYAMTDLNKEEKLFLQIDE